MRDFVILHSAQDFTDIDHGLCLLFSNSRSWATRRVYWVGSRPEGVGSTQFSAGVCVPRDVKSLSRKNVITRKCYGGDYYYGSKKTFRKDNKSLGKKTYESKLEA